MVAIIRCRISSSLSVLSKNTKNNIYRTAIFLVVLCGCETGSLVLREECRLSGFENRVLRRIFGPKRDEVTGEWRRLHKVKLYALYSSRKMRWAKHVARMGERGVAYRVLVGKENTWET
jgi:hypothetical protein